MIERVNSDLEIRSFNSDDGTFEGYGAVFGNVDSHADVIEPGAFKDTLAEVKASGEWPKMLLMHGMGNNALEDQMPIGIWTKMEEDGKGLHVEGKLALGNQRANNVHALLKMTPRPALNGLSVGYRARRFTIHPKGSIARRTLHAVHLSEVSLVTDPSNRLARVSSVKSHSQAHNDAAEKFALALCKLAAAVRG